MKKMLLAAMAVLLMCACSSERGYLNYRGLSMGIKASAMADSLVAMLPNLAVDTAKSGDGQTVLADTLAQNFAVTIYHHNDTISDILESYVATYNDSTSNLWQKLHDELQQTMGWPNMGKHGDLHKDATFENESGTVVLTLLNTYSPTLSVRYSISTTQD